MFFVVATINLVLLTVVTLLVFQIRRFVQDAEAYSHKHRDEILHPMLDYEHIHSIPRSRDIEVLLFAVVLWLVIYLLAVVSQEGRSWATIYPHWWVWFESAAILVYSYGLIRYTRHTVPPDRSEWHRAYRQTQDFLLIRYTTLGVLGISGLWMFFYLPTLDFMPLPERIQLYRQPLLLVRFWNLLVLAYLLNWLLRARGEVTLLFKTIGSLLLVTGMIGVWLTLFLFAGDQQRWAFWSGYHLFFTGVFLCFILLLFKDTMELLSATHKAAQVIAEEKRVMLDFMVKVLDAPQIDVQGKLSPSRQNVDHILNLTLHFSMSQSDAQAGAIYLLDTVSRPPGSGGEGGEGKWLIPRVVEGLFPPLQELPIDYLATRVKYINELFLNERIEIDHYPFYRDILADRKMKHIAVVSRDDKLPQQRIDFLRIHTLVAVPLTMNEQPLGILVVINKESGSEDGWEAFTSQDASLIAAVADQAAVAITNARMHEIIDEQERFEREIEIARKVQESLLPAHFPKLERYEIRAFSEPARQIGGDYFDFVWIDEHRLSIVIADVAGKGVPGALTMATLRSALRALARGVSGPRDLTIQLNRFIFDDLKRDVFISLTTAILDLETNVLKVVRAGHEPLMVIKQQAPNAENIAPEGMALGLDCSALFEDCLEEYAINLEPGDRIVLYTDGVTEAMNTSSQEFGLGRLVKTMEATRDETIDVALETMRTELDRFVGDIPRHDDITMVLLEMKPAADQNQSGLRPPNKGIDG